MYDITIDDILLIKQPLIHLRVRIEVLNFDNEIIERIEGGLISGTSSVSSTSDIRRTCSLQITPSAQSDLNVSESGVIWLDKKIRVYLGIKNIRTEEYTYWAQGEYYFTSTSATYDATNNTISLECSDGMSLLDGSRGGNLGQKEIKFPAYEEDSNTGKAIKYNYIREAIITVLKEFCNIKNYDIEWVGEAKAQPGYKANWDYINYREKTLIPGTDGKMYYQCFAIPNDLEFTSGTTVLTILTELRDIYENYEMFFNEDGVFICKWIPSGDGDPIIFDNSFLESILISENLNIDFNEVKNVTEAWGKCFEPEWYCDTGVSYSGNVYAATVDKYVDSDHKEYYNGDEIALKIPTTNAAGCYINLNGLGNIPVYDENTETPIGAGVMLANTVYDFKIKKRYDTNTRQNSIVAYLQGNWEVHAIDVLTDGTTGENVKFNNGVVAPKYSERYFKELYSCNNIHFTVIPDSPFTVQKLGIILNVYDNENMTSDSLGVEGARQENYRVNRLTDNITITTKICPFADVNQKVSYKRRDRNEPEEYMVKEISHDWSAGTTSWTLMKYYELYTS